MSASATKQASLVAALLGGKTLEQAAKASGVAYSTARRWADDPGFRAELAAARRAIIESALDILTAGARMAAGELLNILHDRSIAPSVRLRAAEAVLERLHRWTELEDLAARIDVLEARYACDE